MGLLGHKTDDTTATFFWWLVFAPFLISLLSIAVQLLTWFKNGVWTKYPLMEFFDHPIFEGAVTSTAFYKWLHFPNDWLGLHALVAFFFQYPIAIIGIWAIGLIIWLKSLK